MTSKGVIDQLFREDHLPGYTKDFGELENTLAMAESRVRNPKLLRDQYKKQCKVRFLTFSVRIYFASVFTTDVRRKKT